MSEAPLDSAVVSEVRGANEVAKAGCNVSLAGIRRGAALLSEAIAIIDCPAAAKLIKSWLDKGYNLALAYTFTRPCTECAFEALHAVASGAIEPLTMAQNLFNASGSALPVGRGSSLAQFVASFALATPRWESLGLFFLTLARAAGKIEHFGELYRTIEQRQSLQRTATELSTWCLDMALSLDRLNDLQLVVQYENCIALGYVYGDQSDYRQ